MTNKILYFTARLLLIQVKSLLSENERNAILKQFDDLGKMLKNES